MMGRSSFIPLMVPDIRQEDIDAVAEVLRSGMLVQGTRVEELEKTFTRLVGVNHAIAVSNGTASLHLALLALGIGKGDEVIVPAFSFIATANVVELVGAKPVFVDIELETFNIDNKQIEKAITPRTIAIMPVHEFGMACNISEICQLAKKHGLKVIEDAACALGAIENDRFTGSFGDIGSFSFHPRKAITSGEGGMITTNDDELARKIRALRNHGMETRDGKVEFVLAGFNYRMTDFQAALLSSQFHRFQTILEYKQTLAELYLDELKDLDWILMPKTPQNKRHSWQSFHIVLSDQINRDRVIHKLKEKGVGTNLGGQCMPYQTYYIDKYGYNCLDLFPNSMKSFAQGLVLPLYPMLTKDMILSIVYNIKSLLK